MLDHVIHRPVGVFIKVVLILVAIVIVGFKSLQIATKKVCPGDSSTLDHVIHRPVSVFIKVVLILVAIVIVGFKSLQIATKKVCPGDSSTLDHVIHRPVSVFIKVVLILVAIVIVGFKSPLKRYALGTSSTDARGDYAHNLAQGFPTLGTNFSNCSVQVRQKHGDRCIYCQCRVAPDGGDYRRPGASGLSEQQRGVLQSSTRVQP